MTRAGKAGKQSGFYQKLLQNVWKTIMDFLFLAVFSFGEAVATLAKWNREMSKLDPIH